MPAEDKILIESIEFLAHCGASESERNALQRISVSIELTLDLEPASKSEKLGETVDYESVVAKIVQTGKSRHFHLLESMAGEIARELDFWPAIQSVRIRVKKMTPPVEAVRGCFGVELCRRRER